MFICSCRVVNIKSPDRNVHDLHMSCVCHAFASVRCCLVVPWGEGDDLLTLARDVYCDFVAIPFGILGQTWYLIVSIPDPCCLSGCGERRS